MIHHDASHLPQSCLCVTTMLDDDAKEASDTTVVLLRSQVGEGEGRGADGGRVEVTVAIDSPSHLTPPC